MNRTGRLVLLASAATLVGAALWTDFPMCPMAGSFGIPCPGCGLTRATLALVRGDWRSALHFHPLVWLLLPLALGFALVAGREMLRGPELSRSSTRRQWTGRVPTIIALSVLVLTFGVWAARFAGYFGGPVPVTTLRAWLAR